MPGHAVIHSDPVSVSLISPSVLADTLLLEMRQTRAPADATSFDRFWPRRRRLFPRHAVGAIILPPASAGIHAAG
jgi:hypothetical protein